MEDRAYLVTFRIVECSVNQWQVASRKLLQESVDPLALNYRNINRDKSNRCKAANILDSNRI